MANEMTIREAYEQHLTTLESSVESFARLVAPEKITALMLNEATKTPQLYECMKSTAGRASIVTFYHLSAQTGLEPGSGLGLLWATPRKNKSGQWTILPIIGYKGYCDLAHRSGKVKEIYANPIYQDEVERGLIKISKAPPDVVHNYDFSVDESDDQLVGAYAVVVMENGGKSVLAMKRDKIIDHAKRGGSFNASFSPWKSDFAAMARKTVLRSLLSSGVVPLSYELRVAIAGDVDEENGKPVQQDEPAPEEDHRSGSDELKDALGINNGDDDIIDGEYEEVDGDSPFPDEPNTMV